MTPLSHSFRFFILVIYLFSLLSLARGLSIYIFKKSFCFHWLFFSYFPVFNFITSLILLLIFSAFSRYHYSILFDAQIVPGLVSGDFLRWPLCHFDLIWLVIECFLAFWQNKMSVFQLVLTLPQPGKLHFFRKLVSVSILHDYSFLSFKLWTNLLHRIIPFAFLS